MGTSVVQICRCLKSPGRSGWQECAVGAWPGTGHLPCHGWQHPARAGARVSCITATEGLQHGGEPERHRPWGLTPPRPPPAPSLSEALGAQPAPAFAYTASPPCPPPLSPSPEGHPGVRPRPQAPATARGPAGPVVRGMGAPGRPRRCFGLCCPGNAPAGRGAEPGGSRFLQPPPIRRGPGVHPQRPRSCSAGCGTPGVHGPRSRLREPVRGTTTRRSRPREGQGCWGEPPRENRAPPARGARTIVGGTRSRTALPWGGGDAPRPHPAPRPPGRGAPPNRFHRGLPAPHGGPSPPSAPAEPWGSPVPSGVRQGDAQPGLPVWLPVSLPVATPGGGVTAEGRGPGVTLAVAPARPCLSFPSSHSGDSPQSGWDRIPNPGGDTGPGAGSAPPGLGATACPRPGPATCPRRGPAPITAEPRRGPDPATPPRHGHGGAAGPGGHGWGGLPPWRGVAGGGQRRAPHAAVAGAVGVGGAVPPPAPTGERGPPAPRQTPGFSKKKKIFPRVFSSRFAAPEPCEGPEPPDAIAPRPPHSTHRTAPVLNRGGPGGVAVNNRGAAGPAGPLGPYLGATAAGAERRCGQDVASEVPAIPVTPWEGEAPHAGPCSPLACPRRWERPQPLPAPPAPGRRQLCRGALPKRRGLDAFPPPGRPRCAPGSCDPPSTPCHPPPHRGQQSLPSEFGTAVPGGVSSRAPLSPSFVGTPVVFVPPPAVGNEPPLHRKSLLMDRAPPPAGPPRCRGPSPAGQPPARLIPAPARGDLLRPGPMND
ncbi:basic proline-rich protein-like [Prinia subflava]|uniref:basic proline-rich protein-like n=1 Tax=Prinia subflava TaxID=208062 RepID=UPI002FDF6458